MKLVCRVRVIVRIYLDWKIALYETSDSKIATVLSLRKLFEIFSLQTKSAARKPIMKSIRNDKLDRRITALFVNLLTNNTKRIFC